ncbi:putative ubiquinone biosynthesis monooxygenase [Toensbergia leucococca]|nr:putative ubiquinone biosynthesis monooxygenase [Toensbergia leucococca]
MRIQHPPLSLKPYVCTSCARSIKLRSRRYATAVQSTPETYDVVCVGGGPVGLSLLTALRSSKQTSHLKLALVESQDLAPARTWQLPPSRYSNRASSLTPSSQSFLSQIGAWQHLDPTRIQPYQHMHVWDALAPSSISFAHPSPSTRPIACMTENPNLVRALLTRLTELEPISIFDKTTLSSIHLGPKTLPPSSNLNLSSWPHLTLSSGRLLTARLLVGADGFNSPVRSYAGIPSRGWDYNRHGIVATVKLAGVNNSNSNEKVAYQRFLPSGPIALLALPEDYATLVWTTTPEQASNLKAMPSADFVAMVNAGFRLNAVDVNFMLGMEKGQIEELDWRESVTKPEAGTPLPRKVLNVQDHSVASFPLRMRHADSYTADRVALVGDAAHTIHPLAGQGLNLGIGDSRALANAIAFAAGVGGDVGKVGGCLERYAGERYAGNGRVMGVVDKLSWLYGKRGGAIVEARALGLRGMNALEGVKGWIMRMAGG